MCVCVPDGRNVADKLVEKCGGKCQFRGKKRDLIDRGRPPAIRVHACECVFASENAFSIMTKDFVVE